MASVLRPSYWHTVFGAAYRAATQNVVAFPNSVLQNDRGIPRWQLWSLKALFIGFVAAEVAVGNYLRDWGLFSERFIGAAVGMLIIYILMVWLTAAASHLSLRNDTLDSGRVLFLTGDRTITRRRLWVGRLVALVFLVGATIQPEMVSFLGMLFFVVGVYWLSLRALSAKNADHIQKTSG